MNVAAVWATLLSHVFIVLPVSAFLFQALPAEIWTSARRVATHLCITWTIEAWSTIPHTHQIFAWCLCSRQTRVLRAMTSMSDDGRDVEGNGECEGGSPSRVQSSRKSMEHVEEQPTTKPVDRRAEHMLKERAEEEGLSEEQPEISGSTLGPWDDSQPHQQQEAPDAERAPSPEPQGEERERPSPLPAPVSSCQSARDKAVDLLPWWAGAFGAVPEMEDSPEARGFYARRFCHIFFPDNAAGATEVGPSRRSTPRTQCSYLAVSYVCLTPGVGISMTDFLIR